MNATPRVFSAWFPLAVAVTLVCGLIYTGVQQTYRQGLDDPQIQMAEDGAMRLAAGGVPAELVQRGVPKVDAVQSLSPWIAVYDGSGMPLESSAVLNNAPPKPPAGVFDESGWKRGILASNVAKTAVPENRVTWQPEPGVRIALVIVPVEGSEYFVVAGRNMREVERRTSVFTTTLGIGWLFTLFATLVAVALTRRGA